MTENKKRFRIDFTVDAEGWSDDYIKESAIQELTCMVPYPEDISFSEVDNPWHTGTPTEEGLYLTTVKVDNCYAYEPVYWKNKWCFRHFDKPIVAWQKIEPYEASKETD